MTSVGVSSENSGPGQVGRPRTWSRTTRRPRWWRSTPHRPSTLAVGLYGHLAPRLRCVHAWAVEHLRVRAGAYDVLYSVFGAVDFTEPRALLPAACAALRPGGRLVFSTLAHHVGGAPPGRR